MASKFQFAYDDSHLVLMMLEDQPIDVKTNLWSALDVDSISTKLLVLFTEMPASLAFFHEIRS